MARPALTVMRSPPRWERDNCGRPPRCRGRRSRRPPSQRPWPYPRMPPVHPAWLDDEIVALDDFDEAGGHERGGDIARILLRVGQLRDGTVAGVPDHRRHPLLGIS